MATIHLLPEIIINQIAAGEVIDRPASIIKELIENSIDAKSKNITIKFQDGGVSLLSVVDDGIGMCEEDAELSFQRNATSKLTQIHDLESLNTFGFRGEAISSIASVGRVLMQTNDGNTATEIFYDSGKKIHQKACSCNRGTFIEIKNLFEKIPARKQFLKSNATESMHIIKLVRAFVLSEPDINFELYRNGKLLFRSPKLKDLESRAEALFGHFDQYLHLNYENDRMKLSGILFEQAIDGLVSKPDFLIFVNKRNVNNPAIVRIVRDTYSMVSARSANVGAFLFLNFPDNFVDYNVHPQKKEIRFKHEYLVKKFVENSVADALQKKIESIRISGQTMYNTRSSELLSNGSIFNNFNNLRKIESLNSSGNIFHENKNHIFNQNTNYLQNNSGNISSGHGNFPLENIEVNQVQSHEGDSNLVDASDIIPKVFELSCERGLENFPDDLSSQNHALWNFIGMFEKNRFAIFESTTGLIFVDIAAAQKCIFYDQFLYNSESLVSQILLMPKLVLVDVDKVKVIDSIIPVLSGFGIMVENFGKDIYKITALPREISEEMIVNFLQDDNISNMSNLSRENFSKKICSHLPFSSYDEMEIKDLMWKLLRCRQFLISPNGSNVIFEIDRCDLYKKFGLQSTSKKYCTYGP